MVRSGTSGREDAVGVADFYYRKQIALHGCPDEVIVIRAGNYQSRMSSILERCELRCDAQWTFRAYHQWTLSIILLWNRAVRTKRSQPKSMKFGTSCCRPLSLGIGLLQKLHELLLTNAALCARKSHKEH